MDISCNDREPYRQDFNPDNELAIVVNPKVPTHLLAGSNDYFYRFNNSTGARQALVPTGFFTSFDASPAGSTDRCRSRAATAPATRHRPSTASSPGTPHGGLGDDGAARERRRLGRSVRLAGHVSVSYSPDGGMTWSQPTSR